MAITVDSILFGQHVDDQWWSFAKEIMTARKMLKDDLDQKILSDRLFCLIAFWSFSLFLMNQNVSFLPFQTTLWKVQKNVI